MNHLHKLVIGCLSLALLWSTPLPAQTITARLDIGRRDPKPDFYVYSPSDQGLVTMGPNSKASSRFVGLVKYGPDLKRQWKKTVLEQNGNKNVDFVTIIGPNIFVFVSEFFPKEKVIKTYYYGYDLEGNQIADEAILSIYPNQKEQKVDLQYVLSPNKRQLLCHKNLEKKREAETILFYIFDDEGDYVQNGEIDIKYPDNRFKIRSLWVSNEGNVFVLGAADLSSGLGRSNDARKYLLYRYDVTTQQGIEIPIDLGTRFISELAFRLDRDENIYVAGFYSNQGGEQIAGTLLQKISPQGQLLQNSIQAFDANFLSNYLSSGQIERGKELRNFYMKPQDGIILRSDGGVLLIAEKFYITYQSYRDMYGYWVDRERYHYEDVILTSISGNGQMEWNAIVDKNQVSENRAHLSYFNAIGPQGTYIFYEYQPRRNALNVYYNTIGIDGYVSERQALIKDFHFTDEFYPRYCEQISNDEAIMVYMQNKGKMLSVIKVDLGE